MGAAAWDGCLPCAFVGVFPLEVPLPRPLGAGLDVVALPDVAGHLSFPLFLPLSFPLLLDLSRLSALPEGADVGAGELLPLPLPLANAMPLPLTLGCRDGGK